MQINKILLVGILCAYTFFSYAQTTIAFEEIRLLFNEWQESIEAVSINIFNTKFRVISTDKGRYGLKDITLDNYKRQIRAIYYNHIVRAIVMKPYESKQLYFLLDRDVNQTDEIAVIGRIKNFAFYFSYYILLLVGSRIKVFYLQTKILCIC